jgi:hypothetical protein
MMSDKLKTFFNQLLAAGFPYSWQLDFDTWLDFKGELLSRGCESQVDIPERHFLLGGTIVTYKPWPRALWFWQ